LAGIKLLNDEQVAALCTEVDELTNTHHPGRELFYEYHSNESTDPNTVLFHALGAWRVTPGLHDVLWNPAFVMAAAQLLQAPVRFWHDQIFYKPARHGGVVRGTGLLLLDKNQADGSSLMLDWPDDSTIENGCVHYVPRSHQWELLPITGWLTT
jgi:hypothetical protein